MRVLSGCHPLSRYSPASTFPCWEVCTPDIVSIQVRGREQLRVGLGTMEEGLGWRTTRRVRATGPRSTSPSFCAVGGVCI